MEQVNCSQVPGVNLLARHQSHHLVLKEASSLQAVSRETRFKEASRSQSILLANPRQITDLIHQKTKSKTSPPPPNRCVLVWYPP